MRDYARHVIDTACPAQRQGKVALHAEALLAGFIGLVIFMILAFDRPFRGDVGLDPDPYQQVHDAVMQDLR